MFPLYLLRIHLQKTNICLYMTHCAISVLCVLEVLSNVVDDLDDEALHDAVVAVQREIDVLTARQAQLLARWDARKIWSQDGSLSCGHRYARETGLSVKEAKHLVHRASLPTSQWL